jgi:hypothetical protein
LLFEPRMKKRTPEARSLTIATPVHLAAATGGAIDISLPHIDLPTKKVYPGDTASGGQYERIEWTWTVGGVMGMDDWQQPH